MTTTGWAPVPTMLHKLHATENDFLVHVALDGESRLDAARVVQICDRWAGIGADGLITLGPATEPGSDCSFRLTNADGSEAEMSGNGMRCLAVVAANRGIGTSDRILVDTLGGTRTVELRRDDAGRVVGAVVDMGAPILDPERIPVLAENPAGLRVEAGPGRVYDGDAIGMGNPHFVTFVDDPQQIEIVPDGPALEHAAVFPNRTNVEFVHVDAREAITMRVWERGAGETRSCGTGACAAAVAAHRRGLVGERVTVTVPGGTLDVEIGDTIRLGGPVVEVATIWCDTSGSMITSA